MGGWEKRNNEAIDVVLLGGKIQNLLYFVATGHSPSCEAFLTCFLLIQKSAFQRPSSDAETNQTLINYFKTYAPSGPCRARKSQLRDRHTLSELRIGTGTLCNSHLRATRTNCDIKLTRFGGKLVYEAGVNLSLRSAGNEVLPSAATVLPSPRS